MDNSLFYLKLDAAFSQSMGLLISSIFITPLLLQHGATLIHIGLFSVIAYLASFAQLLSIRLLSKYDQPKSICVLASLLARITLLFTGLIITLYSSIKPEIILMLFLIFYILSNISSMAFSYWMYYLVPQNIRGRFFASRMRNALIVANIVVLSITFCMQNLLLIGSINFYDILPLLSSLLGLIGLAFLYQVKGVKSLNPVKPSMSIVRNLLRTNPLRKHTKSVFLLYFAISMVTPFYTYYLLIKLGLSIMLIVALNALSQLSLILFVNTWGEFIDKYGVKPVLRLNAYLYTITFLIWPFTTLPNQYPLSIPLLILIFLMIGISTGGLNLSANLISYKLTRDKDSAYSIMVNNIAISIGNLFGSIMGTMLATPFSYIELSLIFTVKWGSINHFFLIDISDLDFLFLLAAVIGFTALSQLRNYKVIDEEDEEQKYVELIVGLRRYLNGYRGIVTTIIGNGVRKLEESVNNGRRMIKLRKIRSTSIKSR